MGHPRTGQVVVPPEIAGRVLPSVSDSQHRGRRPVGPSPLVYLGSRDTTPLLPSRQPPSQSQSTLKTRARYQPFGTDVLVEVRPADDHATTDRLPVIPLSIRAVAQSRITRPTAQPLPGRHPATPEYCHPQPSGQPRGGTDQPKNSCHLLAHQVALMSRYPVTSIVSSSFPCEGGIGSPGVPTDATLPAETLSQAIWRAQDARLHHPRQRRKSQLRRDIQQSSPPSGPAPPLRKAWATARGDRRDVERCGQKVGIREARPLPQA